MTRRVPPKVQKFPAAKQRLLDRLLEKNSEGTRWTYTYDQRNQMLTARTTWRA